ncbi:hypothetical protein ACVBA1_004711, partial [Escherichia coli]
TAKPSRKRRKNRTEPYRIIDTFQRRLATSQTSLDLLPQYDTDIESRANELWKKAVHTINNTTREERRVCYITLNRPEEEHSDPADIPSVKAILNTLLPLEMLFPVPDLTAPSPHKKMLLRTHQVENKRVVKKDSDNTCMTDFNNNLYAIINLLRSP